MMDLIKENVETQKANGVRPIVCGFIMIIAVCSPRRPRILSCHCRLRCTDFVDRVCRCNRGGGGSRRLPCWEVKAS